jgi:ABC-type transporter Mla subunit MlaD
MVHIDNLAELVTALEAESVAAKAAARKAKRLLERIADNTAEDITETTAASTKLLAGVVAKKTDLVNARTAVDDILKP